MYYRTPEDADTDSPWNPPQVVAIIQTAKSANVPPWTLCNVPYSIYWRRAMATIQNAENEADAAAHRAMNRKH